MNQPDDYLEEAAASADRFGVVEPHDKWCQGSELCRECFIAKLREAKKAAEHAGRSISLIGNGQGQVDVYMSGDELNSRVKVFRREPQGKWKLYNAGVLFADDPQAHSKALDVIFAELQMRRKRYPVWNVN